MASTSTGPITDSEVEAEYNEVKYSPFHRIHGSNVVLSKDGCVARRAKGYDKAVVFSSKPIPIGNRFQVVITNMEQEWSGTLVSQRSHTRTCCTTSTDVVRWGWIVYCDVKVSLI